MYTEGLPTCYITTEVGLIEIMRKASETLDNAGRNGDAKEMCYRLAQCDDDYLARAIIDDYVNVVSLTEEEAGDEEFVYLQMK